MHLVGWATPMPKELFAAHLVAQRLSKDWRPIGGKHLRADGTVILFTARDANFAGQAQDAIAIGLIEIAACKEVLQVRHARAIEIDFFMKLIKIRVLPNPCRLLFG